MIKRIWAQKNLPDPEYIIPKLGYYDSLLCSAAQRDPTKYRIVEQCYLEDVLNIVYLNRIDMLNQKISIIASLPDD
ncbi:MAG TPA: hypothetical protein VNN76_11520 [Bacteroidota bacterium]|nr:hypothetical protein [Bacteroidota bacterium]